jgi:hypothetical protein
LRQALFKDAEDKRIKEKDLHSVLCNGWRERIDKDDHDIS